MRKSIIPRTAVDIAKVPIPLPIPKVRLKRVAWHANNLTGKVDDAINMISLNGTIIETVNAHAIDKLQHGVQVIQTDFLFASKLMLLSRFIGALFANESQKKVNAAIYMSLILIVIFVSDKF